VGAANLSSLSAAGFRMEDNQFKLGILALACLRDLPELVALDRS
jgi:hypothetical protein